MSSLNYEGIHSITEWVTTEKHLASSEPVRIFKLDRRQFMKLTGLTGGGLMLSFSLPKAMATSETLHPNGFVRIDTDGITIFAKNPEVGQGVKTSLPMIVAEELDANWEDVHVVQSEIDQARYGAQFAGGSLSIPMNWASLRQAGASVRSMLVSAAAKRLNVPETELSTVDSHVVHQATNQKLPYTELASDAAKEEVPAAGKLKLKSANDFRILGKRITGVDNEALVRGQPLFGIDQVVPNMKYAVYQKCPAIGGSVKSANVEEIKALPGVVDAFVLEGNDNAQDLLPGVAIVADSTYHAMQAKRRLDVTWDETNASKDSWSDAVKQASELRQKKNAKIVTATGSTDAAFSNAEKTVSSFYTYHFVSHAQLEPQNCTASYSDNAIEIWAPSQTPGSGIQAVSRVTGIDMANIKLNQLRIGGGFGRRLYNDFMCEAAAISQKAGVPIKLQWTREDDMSYDLYRAGGFHQMDGSLDADGKITGWRDHLITFANGGRPVSGGSLGEGIFPHGLIKNVRFEQSQIDWKNRCAAWRAPGSNVFGFVVQSFLHELATEAGRDHLEVLLEVFGEPRMLVPNNPRSLNTERAANVVSVAAERAGWGRKLPKGRGLGIAFYFSHMGHVAEVADVSVSDDKKIKVNKVHVVADVGPIINLSGAENQMQGSVVDGLSTMLGLSVTFENGRVQQSNFDKYPMLRMAATPEIDVHFIESDHSPTGLGEPALPPLAPAVCNAIFAASVHRIRTLPISEEGFHV